jgi:hypothetical protein
MRSEYRGEGGLIAFTSYCILWFMREHPPRLSPLRQAASTHPRPRMTTSTPPPDRPERVRRACGTHERRHRIIAKTAAAQDGLPRGGLVCGGRRGVGGGGGGGWWGMGGGSLHLTASHSSEAKTPGRPAAKGHADAIRAHGGAHAQGRGQPRRRKLRGEGGRGGGDIP